MSKASLTALTEELNPHLEGPRDEHVVTCERANKGSMYSVLHKQWGQAMKICNQHSSWNKIHPATLH